MTRHGYVETTYTVEGEDGDVMNEIEVRVHYTFVPGSPAVLWGDNAHPEEHPEIELDRVDWDTGAKPPHRWQKAPRALVDWAAEWLASDAGWDAVLRDQREAAEEAAEARAEARRDRD